ncbi:MAG: hypothetical protein KA385_08705 [Vicinamibacteria bacterium]|nr:hypothetical protein [Vicinamibacteria bacterium]
MIHGRGLWRIAVAIAYVTWAGLFIASTRIRTPDGRMWSCLFDDAMISMRYARNLAEGHGLVFNAGEYVQGFSNPLMTLLMAALIGALGPIASVTAVQWLAIPTILGCAFLAARIARHLYPDSEFASGFAFVATLAYYPLSYWALMGMETGLLTLLLLGAIAAIQQERWSLSGLLLGAAYMTRPDALVPAALIFAGLWLMETPRKAVLQSGAIFAGILLTTQVSQRLYYGSWLPNTYTLKLEGIPLATRLLDGLAFSTPLIIESLPLWILALTAFRASPALGRGLLGLCGAATAYQIYVGGDSWPGHWRFTTPYWPLAAIVAAASPFLAGPLPRRWLLAAVVLIAGNARFADELLLVREPFGVEGNRDNVRVALALRRLTTEKASVGAAWAGALPYYSERRGIDFLGKSDRYVALRPPDLSGAIAWGGLHSVPGHNKYDLAHSVDQLKPDYVQMFRWGNQSADSSPYVTVWYGRFLLRLRRDSENVRWSQLRCGPADCRAINPWR